MSGLTLDLTLQLLGCVKLSLFKQLRDRIFLLIAEHCCSVFEDLSRGITQNSSGILRLERMIKLVYISGFR